VATPQKRTKWPIVRTSVNQERRREKTPAHTIKAKFHYASWLRTSSEQAPNMFGASSELASVMEFGF